MLGAILLGEADPLEALESQDFSLVKHRLIFSAASKLRAAGEPVDRITVVAELRSTGKLEAVDGLSYLVSLDDDLPKIYAINGYTHRLRDLGILRRATLRAQALIEECCSPGADLDAIAQAAEFLEATHNERKRAENEPLKLGEYLERHGGIDRFLSPPGAQNVISTPWSGMNDLLYGGGFTAGQLVIVAARPSMGKSALAAQFAVHAAAQGRATDVFSFEMGSAEIWRRMLAHVGKVSFGRIGHGSLSLMDRHQAMCAVTDLNEWPLYIDETAGCTVASLERAVRKQRAKQVPVACIVVDYLQLMESARRREKRNEEVAEITRRLKLAARSLKAPMIVLAQLNRDPDKERRPPELRDLGESGSIERDADVVIFLWRDPKEVRAAIDERRPGWIDLILSKQRNGPPGRVRTMFDPGTMTLSESLDGAGTSTRS